MTLIIVALSGISTPYIPVRQLDANQPFDAISRRSSVRRTGLFSIVDGG
jgi:hypothetical protein